MSYNYETLKQFAKDSGNRVPDLLALAPKNDPFYIGSPATVTAAQWFTAVWKRAGFNSGVHLRRVHYWLVSHPVKLPTQEPYQNNEACWKWLADAGKYARYLGYISADSFVDRRNPEAKIYDHKPDEEPDPGIYITDWELPKMELPEPPSLVATGYDNAQQDYTVEIWAEKSTMNDVLEPLCKEYSVNLVTGLGELSITAVRDFLRRVRKPTRILYVSDFDPAGNGMPVSVARKIEFYQRNDGCGNMDIALQPIVLTAEQVQEYNLPRIPVKDSDARKGNFEAAHGEGQVELDALEALHPGELSRILEEEILRYIDPDLQSESYAAEETFQTELDEATARVYKPYETELDQLRQEYSEIAPRYAALKERIEKVYRQITDQLNDEVIEPEPLPGPEVRGDFYGLLYTSGRDYFEQLEVYKIHRNGNE